MSENELSHLIIGRAIEVHRELGPGLLESIYQHCLAFELIEAGLNIRVQHPLPVNYKGQPMDLGFRLDIWVDHKVVVEVKAVDALHDVHLAQVLTYLKLVNKKLGLLINFNVPRLRDGVKRIVLGLPEA